MRQFYQHYFTATAKLCWLRWLSVPQRLTMLEAYIKSIIPNDEARRCPMRQFYQHYFTATAKLCWLRWLSVPQRLTMLEGLMQWDDRNSES